MKSSVDRPVVLTAVVLMNLCLGGVYAWSAFVPRLREAYGYSSVQMQCVFGCCIGVLTLASMVAGRLLDRHGPRFVCVWSALLLSSGYVVAGTFGDHYTFLLLGFGVLGGIGVGFGYVSGIAVAVRWLPDRAGLGSGLAVAGYAGAAILLSNLAHPLMAAGWTPLAVLRAAGIACAVVISCAAFLTMPAGTPAQNPLHFPRGRLLRERRFWALSLGIFAATFPGISTIGSLEPIGLQFGIEGWVAAAAISVLALGNVTGRLFWGMLHDRLGGRTAVLLCMALTVLSLPLVHAGRCGGWAFLAASLALGLSYGGGLSLFPAQTAEYYGPHFVGAVYPVVLISHGLAGIIGAPLAGLLYDTTQSYVPGLWAAAAVALVGLIGFDVLSRGLPAQDSDA